MVSTKESSLEELYTSRDFFFFSLEHTHKRKNLVLSLRKLYPFVILTRYKDLCSHRSGKGRAPGKEDMFLGKLTALIRRKSLA